jgi:signal transduction histidine kinase
MNKMLSLFHSKNNLFLILFGIIAVIFIGLIDYVTGYRLGSIILYVIPIFVVTYKGGFRQGLVVSIFRAVIWLMADAFSRPGYLNIFVPIWNTALRFSIFLLIVYLISKVRIFQKLKEDLTHFVIHDLKTPLTSMMIGLDFLKETASEEQKKIIETNKISCLRMNSMIGSILDIYRMENKKMVLKIDDVDLKELVDDSIYEVSVWAQKNRVDLKVNFESKTKTLKTDRGLMLRVLVNLLSNAIKISPEHAMVRITLLDMDNGVMVQVRDEGPGMPSELAKKISDPYVQLRAKQMGVNIGSGLGLSFCKMIMDFLGGRLQIESQEKVGTTISLLFPRNQSSQKFLNTVRSLLS